MIELGLQYHEVSPSSLTLVWMMISVLIHEADILLSILSLLLNSMPDTYPKNSHDFDLCLPLIPTCGLWTTPVSLLVHHVFLLLLPR